MYISSLIVNQDQQQERVSIAMRMLKDALHALEFHRMPRARVQMLPAETLQAPSIKYR